MGPGDPFDRSGGGARRPDAEFGGGLSTVSDKRLALGFGIGALLGLCLWQLGLGATLAALVMGGLGMLVAARSDVVLRVARTLWQRLQS